MGQDAELRSKLLEMIQAGKLPGRHPRRMWGGYGQGEPCALCHQAVQQDQMGLEAEFANTGEGGQVSHHFHATCFSMMEAELRMIERDARSPSAGPLAIPAPMQAVPSR